MKGRMFVFLVVCFMLCASVAANATTLTFNHVYGVSIPQDYGDNVSDLTPGCEIGNGWTPHITLQWPEPNEVYNGGYGDLPRALIKQESSTAQIVLTPEAGYMVRLNSFDVGAWAAGGEGRATVVTIKDESGQELQSWTNPQIIADAIVGGHSHFTFEQWVAGPVTIEFSGFAYLYDVAIDNIDFDEQSVPPVPEPSAVMALGVGFVGLFGVLSRKKS